MVITLQFLDITMVRFQVMMIIMKMTTVVLMVIVKFIK